MNTKQRKVQVLEKLDLGGFENIYEALRIVEGDFIAMEGIPFGLRNEPIRICEDFTEGKITREESISKLKAFIHSIPD